MLVSKSCIDIICLTGAQPSYVILSLGIFSLKVQSSGPHAVGVVVEGEEGRLYVRVNCKDRKGLLAEIAVALEEVHLQVRRGGGRGDVRGEWGMGEWLGGWERGGAGQKGMREGREEGGRLQVQVMKAGASADKKSREDASK